MGEARLDAMALVARLVHAEPGARVVQVSARRQGQTLGTALGEAATAEEAEDRALTRLRQRLGPEALQPRLQPSPPLPAAAGPVSSAEVSGPGGPSAPAPVRQAAAPPRPPLQQPATLQPTPQQPLPAQPLPEEPPPDPEDWSGELAQIDLQLRRIGWQREQEATYLQRAFGHPSRGRITTFADLMAYLQVLQGLADGSDPAQAPVPLRRPELLNQCDQLLTQLGWDAGRGRQVLERHFARVSRQQLSDRQLLQFNMLLEEALIDPASVERPSTAGS